MAVETRRACGYRRVGGLYLVAPPFTFTCDRGDMPLSVCPCCGAGVKQSRGWTWIEARKMLGIHRIGEDQVLCPDCMQGCLLCLPPGPKSGLLWVGDRFYSPYSFLEEARSLGISKRIVAVPRGFEAGKTVVYLAHPKAVKKINKDFAFGEDLEEDPGSPGIFAAFRPTAVEKIVNDVQAKDEEEMERLRERGITPVVVPSNDPDHYAEY